MTGKKQKDYLADLLADDDAGVTETPSAAQTPSPASASQNPRAARGSGMTLLGRESALARVASGEVSQITRLKLDPARVRIWPGNARIQARLNEDNVRDLIDAILAEGGQKMPAIVRRVSDDPAHDYEVIAGTRRHFAISWLRANSYPEMALLAEARDIDDEAAFRLADIENRARQDVSEIERARNYAAALKEHYGGKQRRMAERLKLSEGWLSKMLKVATLPDRILAAFPDLGELTLNPAYKLSQALADDKRRKSILTEADRIANDNTQRSDDGQLAPGGTAIFNRLLASGETESAKPDLFKGLSRHDRPALSVTSTNRQGLTIKVHAASGADEDEIVTLFRAALAKHEYRPDAEKPGSE